MQNQKNCSQRSNSGFLFSSGQSQILSFSSPSSHSFVLPQSHHRFSSPHSYNTGSVSGGLNGADMNAILSGVKGPFTPSQWMELEHQALIYKYINENNPVPSDLLNPIRKALQSAQLSSYSGLNTWPGNLEWGTSHLGFPRNTDPELGRCRRTDGKKWRCSKDAVADRKYCERHTKKGRKSSRKPVEGQTGHNISGATTNTTTKFMPMSSTSATLVVPSSGTFYNSGLSENHLNSLQHKTLNPSTSPHLSRSVYSEGYAYEKVQEMEFGLVSSDSLQNPFQKASSMNKSKSYESSAGIDDVEYKSEYSLRQFMGDWPKCQSDTLAIPWPEIDTPSDRTRLSLSMPIVAADFMSSTSSPTSEKLACSPQRISREIGFERNTIIKDMNQRRATWDSICWETSIGGPLGEVLHSSTNSASDSKNTISP